MMTRIIFPLLCAAATLFATPAWSQSDALRADAPDTYTVQRGDTLWGIAERFLQKPWRWPEVWQINREEINNPHLIYPGQVIVLDRMSGRLSIGRVVTDQRLSPKIYSEAVEQAIPSIPLADIEPFLVRQLVVDAEDLAGAGTVVATENQRVYTSEGDIMFAKNISAGAENWQVFRPARPLVDPVTKETLAYEAHYLGEATVVEPGNDSDTPGVSVPTTLRVTSVVEEIGANDRLMVVDQPRILSYVPHAPEVDVDGRIIGIYRGVAETGRHHVVTLNIGARAGLEVGHVIALHRVRGQITYRGDEGKEKFDLPDARYGVAFVFRVFNRVAYALVMDTDGHVSVGDRISRP